LHVAIKVLAGTADQREVLEQRLDREIACWRRLQHRNIPELLGIANFLPGRPPGLVSKFVQRDDFLKYIEMHPELKRNKAIDIAAGLQSHRE